MKKILIFLFVFLYSNPLELINSYREAVGLNELFLNNSLICSSRKHAKYLYINRYVSHYEQKNDKYYFAKTPILRSLKCGYNSRYVIENLSEGEKSYTESIKDLFGAIYHRLGFLDFNINEIGFYKYKNIFVYDLGNGYIARACKNKKETTKGYENICKNRNKIVQASDYYKQMIYNPKIILWPYNGMQNTPAVFYTEFPDPLPGYKVCGYPVSVSFNPYYFNNTEIKLVRFELYKNFKKVTNVKILTYKNDINGILKKTDFVLFPLKRLEYSSKYKAVAVFLINGKYLKLHWNFNVEKLSMPVIQISGKKGKFYISSNITYLIYFKPLNRDDILQNISYKYYNNIKINKIGYKDANTLYINVNGKKGGKIEIHSLNRDIELIIK